MHDAVGLHPDLVVHRERRSAKEPPERRGRAARLGQARRPLGELHGRPRARALLARRTTDIDVLYAHRWGVGWPGAIDNNGPTLGQLGFGVLGSGFSAGMIYGTPSFGGLQLNVGAFDPVQLQGLGNWTRTKYARPEAELTFERTFSDGWGKVRAVRQRRVPEGVQGRVLRPEHFRTRRRCSISPATRRCGAEPVRRPSRARPLSPRCRRPLRTGAGSQLRPRGQRGRAGYDGQPAQEQGRLRADPGRRRKGRPVRRLGDRADRT